MLNILGRPVPVWISYGLFWFYPFGVALNILVLTRPKIRALRINHPELGWIKAFWLVLKAGVDMPDDQSILVKRVFQPLKSGWKIQRQILVLFEMLVA